MFTYFSTGHCIDIGDTVGSELVFREITDYAKQENI